MYLIGKYLGIIVPKYKSLNPYSNGTMYLIGQVVTDKVLRTMCLNPYSNGTMYLMRANLDLWFI